MNFPLYQSLSANLPKKDLTVKQKQALLRKIENFDDETCNLCYALIKTHFILGKGNEEEIPYSGTLNSGTAEFSLLELPVSLRHILSKFANIHEKKLEEDLLLENMKSMNEN